jgi:hypothetical protein
MARWSYWVNSKISVSTSLYHNGMWILLNKLGKFCFNCIATITMTLWSYRLNTKHYLSTALLRSKWHDDHNWENSEHSVSTALLRSQCHDDLTENTLRILFLLHYYDHNDTMTLQTKLQTLFFYCIVMITVARWSYWVNSEHSVSTALLRLQWHEDFNE